MRTLDWGMALSSINIQYLPNEQELDEARKVGQELGVIIE